MSFLSACQTRLVVIAALGGLWQPATATASDPFYSRLLEEGIGAYERGDDRRAAKSLRLASFGLLDEPPVLARCLAYLALAQGETGDEEAFIATFDRILEVERRFEAFSRLDLEAGLRRDLEAYLERWITPETLAGAPMFRHVARRKLEARMVDGSPEERRQELRRLVAAEPENTWWRLLLAELQLGDGDYGAALASAEAALARDPQLERAACVRARASAATGACARALADLDKCAERVEGTALREARLRCLIKLGDWQGAGTLLSELPPGDRSRAPFRQLARDVRRGEKAAARAPAETAPVPDEGTGSAADDDGAVADVGDASADVGEISTDEGGVVAGEGDVSTDELASSTAVPSPPSEPAPEAGPARDGSPPHDASSPDAWPPELEAEIERTRGLVRSGSREELAEALTRARQLADRYPQLTEPHYLAAELAYRLSRWHDVVAFYQRGGVPEPSTPDHLFYFSVALHETGDRAAARNALERCLPFLEMTDFVRSYVERILVAEDG